MKVLILISALVLMTACGKQVSKTNPKDTPKGSPGVVVNPTPNPSGGFEATFTCEGTNSDCSTLKIEANKTYTVQLPQNLTVRRIGFKNTTNTQEYYDYSLPSSISISVLTDRGIQECHYDMVNLNDKTEDVVLEKKHGNGCYDIYEVTSNNLIFFDKAENVHKVMKAQFLP